MMPGDDVFASEDAIRAFFDRKREAVAIKVGHDVMKPDEEFREKSVLAALESDIAAWRKLPKETRVGFFDYEKKRIEAEESACNNVCGKAARAVEAAYAALEACPQGRSALLYLTSDLAASKPCAELLEAHPSVMFDQYRKEIEA